MLRNRKLEKIWRWTNERAPFKYHGQGQHSIKVGDIDGDGADEILNGSIAIDNDGRTMWGTGLGHGDRFYLDGHRSRAAGPRGLVHDRGPASAERRQPVGRAHRHADLRHAASRSRTTRSPAAWPGTSIRRIRAWRCGATSSSTRRRASRSPAPVPPQDELVWWDADLLRETHSRGTIAKWKGATLGATQGSVQHVADILGDWREEIVTVRRRRTADLQHVDPRRRSPRVPDAGSDLSQRRHASLDGLSARADDQLLPGRRLARQARRDEAASP